jgi:hypothetical protein
MRNSVRLALLCSTIVVFTLAIGDPLAFGLARAGEPVSAVQGDADCSGDLSSEDAVSLLEEVAGTGVAPCSDRADTDCDGLTGVKDVLRILLHEGGLSVPSVEDCTALGQADRCLHQRGPVPA